jgi:hypothetical protein
MITEETLLQTFPATAVQEHAALRNHLYYAPDGSLCARASRAHLLPAALPTRISKNAAATIAGLRELVDAGVISFSGTNFHDGNNIEVIEQ